MVNSEAINSSYAQKSVFFRRGSRLRPGSTIPDRTIETHTPTYLCSKFQLSKCYIGKEKAHRETDERMDDITIK
jgi:hypothetical protein